MATRPMNGRARAWRRVLRLIFSPDFLSVLRMVQGCTGAHVSPFSSCPASSFLGEFAPDESKRLAE